LIITEPNVAVKVIGLPLVPEFDGFKSGMYHWPLLATIYVPGKKFTVSPALAFAIAVTAEQG
jgi:hypothetical protein